jgi:hypothetical protein
VGLIVLALLLVDVTGAWQELPWIEIRNDTQETLVLVGVATEERGFNSVREFERGTLEPGETYTESTGRGTCIHLVFVARTLEGHDYASEPHQMCGDDQWIITGVQD